MWISHDLSNKHHQKVGVKHQKPGNNHQTCGLNQQSIGYLQNGGSNQGKNGLNFEAPSMGMHQKQWAGIKTWRRHRYIIWIWCCNGPKDAIFKPFEQCLDGALQMLEMYRSSQRMEFCTPYPHWIPHYNTIFLS